MPIAPSTISPSVKVLCVDPAQIDRVWPHAWHLIKRAYDRQPTDDTFGEVQRRILNGAVLLWVAWDGEKIRAAMAAELWEASKKICAILAIGGDGVDWRSFMPQIEQFARDEGCDVVRFSGRKGWARVFPDYRQPWITLEKELK